MLAPPLLADMLWPVFLLLGWEEVRIDPGNTKFTPLDLFYYPWSHSLLMDGVWATGFALIYYVITRYRNGAIAVWIGVISRWILDWITHRPDMPLYPGGPRLGLGLWTRSPAHCGRTHDFCTRDLAVCAHHAPPRPHRPLCIRGVCGPPARALRRRSLQRSPRPVSPRSR